MKLKNARVLRHPWEQAIGLMFRTKFSQPYVFVLSCERWIPITMLFVLFPIDIYWLDENQHVVDYKRNARPFEVSIWPKKKAQYVVELPVESKIRIGEKIQWN